MKKVIEGISELLTYICNLTFQTSKFSNKMKIAKVVPLYKTGHHFTNDIPVSLLPQFSRILEKLFKNRLDKLIDKHRLLSDSQYRFRSNCLLSLVLTESIEKVTNAISMQLEYLLILKKLSTQSIIINKLERYGIGG